MGSWRRLCDGLPSVSEYVGQWHTTADSQSVRQRAISHVGIYCALSRLQRFTACVVGAATRLGKDALLVRRRHIV